jgi:hypothetical protein
MTQIPTDVGTGDDYPGDIDTDCLQLLLEDLSAGHTAFIEDQAENEEVLGNVIDFRLGQKFGEIGPIEAAAAEVMLKKKV